MIHLELSFRFVVVSLVAFGGGQAALPLVERLAVQDTGWLTPSAFGSAVALSYVTPGPVLIIASFVGYQVAGPLGALSSTLGAFIAPSALAALAAQQVTRFTRDRRLHAFGSGAAPAVVGVLGVTVASLAQEAFVALPYAVIAVGVFVLAMATRLHPLVLLATAAVLGWVAGLL